MSKVQLQGNASGTGIFTIASPNSNTDRTLTLPDNTGTILTGSSAISASQLPAGSVVKVLQTVKTNTQTITGSSYVQISGLTVSITPSSSANKILILVSIGFGGTTNCYPAFELYRDGTAINLSSVGGTGEAASFGNPSPSTEERYLQVNHTFLDSPSSTSSITYSVYVSPMRTNTQTVTINTAKNVGDDNQIKGTSTITVMEVVG